MVKKKLNINSIDAFFFDFDGVLTNNKVYVDQYGNESVRCSRADGLAFKALKKINKPAFIISSEVNPVVKKRAEKLGVKAIIGTFNKLDEIKKIIKKKNFKLSRIFFVGNDINDFGIMNSCGYSACPFDSHTIIKKQSKYNMESRGGDGIIREILEDLFNLDLIKILEIK